MGPPPGSVGQSRRARYRLGRARAVRSARENLFAVFDLLAPNRGLRRTENPRVDGSIPSPATTSKFLITYRVSGITRGLSGAVLPRNRPTSGLSETGSIDGPGATRRGWRSGNLARLAALRGAVGGVHRRGPTLPRSGRGCDARGRGMGAAMGRAGVAGGGEREGRSCRPNCGGRESWEGWPSEVSGYEPEHGCDGLCPALGSRDPLPSPTPGSTAALQDNKYKRTRALHERHTVFVKDVCDPLYQLPFLEPSEAIGTRPSTDVRLRNPEVDGF